MIGLWATRAFGEDLAGIVNRRRPLEPTKPGVLAYVVTEFVHSSAFPKEGFCNAAGVCCPTNHLRGVVDAVRPTQPSSEVGQLYDFAVKPHNPLLPAWRHPAPSSHLPVSVQ